MEKKKLHVCSNIYNLKMPITVETCNKFVFFYNTFKEMNNFFDVCYLKYKVCTFRFDIAVGLGN